MLNILMSGCNGKMGQVITRLCSKEDNIRIVAGVSRQPHKYNNPYNVYESFEDVEEKADVVIDFSNPNILPSMLKYCVNNHCGLVLATTGFSEIDEDMIRQTSEVVPIFKSANMSLGINVMLELVSVAAKKLYQYFDIEVLEKHHNEKVDSPSGTALMIANQIKIVLNNEPEFVFDRTKTRNKRKNNEIGISAIRGGTIPGEHTVFYAGNDEVIEIKHTAISRDVFGAGALKAAQYIATKECNIYDMKEMIKELI